MTDMKIKELKIDELFLIDEIATLCKIRTDCHDSAIELFGSIQFGKVNPDEISALKRAEDALHFAARCADRLIIQKIRDYAADLNQEAHNENG